MLATASLRACLDVYLNPKARRTAAGAALQEKKNKRTESGGTASRSRMLASAGVGLRADDAQGLLGRLSHIPCF
jgi:hypothetical protein